MTFSVGVLLYGDHPQLARRCLSSLVASGLSGKFVQDVRLALNNVSEETHRFVHEQAIPQLTACGIPVFVYTTEARDDIGKYPLMRRMLYSPPAASRWMWFDDDSWLLPSVSQDWWQAVADKQATLLGQPWWIRARGNQTDWIRKQSWCTVEPASRQYKFLFATGGWWVADTYFLYSWNYPFPELYHSGGDSILGELVRQQSGKLVTFYDGVVINGRDPSLPGSVYKQKETPSRGSGRRKRQYVGEDYSPDLAYSLSHQEFSCRVESYKPDNDQS